MQYVKGNANIVLVFTNKLQEKEKLDQIPRKKTSRG